MRTAISLNASSESGKSRFGDDAAGRQTADWEECKAKYESDLRAYQKGLELNNADWDPEVKGAFERTSKRRLPDYRDGKNYLQSEVEIIESQRPLEEVSLARVAGTRILETVSGRRLLECAKGVTRVVREGRFCNGDAEVEAEVSMVEVRSGFKAFAEAIDSRKAAKWGVISVNWSKDWIRGVLSAALERSDEDMARINIISNDLVDSDFISKYRSNGFMVTRLLNPQPQPQPQLTIPRKTKTANSSSPPPTKSPNSAP